MVWSLGYIGLGYIRVVSARSRGRYRDYGCYTGLPWRLYEDDVGFLGIYRRYIGIV